jgi:hypothetical protein
MAPKALHPKAPPPSAELYHEYVKGWCPCHKIASLFKEVGPLLLQPLELDGQESGHWEVVIIIILPGDNEEVSKLCMGWHVGMSV